VIAIAGRLGEGPAVSIARRVASSGTATELIATVPSGPSGDRRLLELAAAGIGHAAARRSDAAALEPADLELALRYLPDVRVVVLAGDAATLGPVASEAAAWSNAALVIAVGDPATSEREATGAGPRSIVLAGPAKDPDGAFAGLVAALAVRLDAGEEPQAAWQQVTARLGVDGVSRSGDPAVGRPPG